MCRAMHTLIPVVIVGMSFGIGSIRAEPFPSQCSFPKAAAGKEQKVDKQCGLAGMGDTPAHKAQNTVKNNFCADGPASTLSRDDFKRLQTAAESARVQFGDRENLPEDRNVLRGIMRLPNNAQVGEGTLVRHVGFLTHPRYSNVRNGESVNCNFRGEESNDIHFDILQDRDEDACFSVTGEITPHRRSPHYEKEVLMQTRVAERPVRVTGQLFFDASHRPCVNGEPKESLQRISLWEIHPVYSIDVCRQKTLGECSADNDSAWIPIERFTNVAEDPDEGHD
jgi:hypothetical protein